MQGVSALEIALYSSSSASPQPSSTTTRRGLSGFCISGFGARWKDWPFVTGASLPVIAITFGSINGTTFGSQGVHWKVTKNNTKLTLDVQMNCKGFSHETPSRQILRCSERRSWAHVNDAANLATRSAARRQKTTGPYTGRHQQKAGQLARMWGQVSSLSGCQRHSCPGSLATLQARPQTATASRCR